MTALRFALFTICLGALSLKADPSQFWGNTKLATDSKDDLYLLQIFALGQIPENTNDEEIIALINHGFAVGYSDERRNPLWAIYKASGTSAGEITRSNRSEFFPRDLRTESKVHGQTFGGGMDRGHMVPNAVIGNQYGSLAQMETFLMSNICPQDGNLNRGAWMRLEGWIRDLADEKEHVFVIVGPIFDENIEFVEKGSERQIQIPDAFYLIIVDTDREYTLDFEGGRIPSVEMISYIFPQDVARNANFTDREAFGASVDDIEAKTGLNFFPHAESVAGQKWTRLEAEKVTRHWPVN
ncbi:MAG: DNA/RNA non-specific endonuclease [Verrucomicrobiota bacterium]